VSTGQRELLRRHRLAHLADETWAKILERDWDPAARDCLLHWRQHRLPLVITRQNPQDLLQGRPLVCLGISAPVNMQRQRIQVLVELDQILCFDEFPLLDEVVRSLPASLRPSLNVLAESLSDIHCRARAYGSHGWQRITGQQHVHGSSDLDIWIDVRDAEHADAIGDLLSAVGDQTLRLDGELVFPDDTAVAWREWRRWRLGECTGILEKSLFGARLRGVDTHRCVVEADV
jgi:phosphoribosyl-dephospho-CoA transferase